jgi:hypothetical protein
MRSSWRFVLGGVAGVVTVAGATLPAHAEGAADFVGGAQYNAKHGVFVAKDLGGGAYWLTTTKSVETAETGAETGRETILSVNHDVIQPVQDATGL